MKNLKTSLEPLQPLHLIIKDQQPASSQGPAASAISGEEDSEYGDEYSAQSQDSGRTVLYPDRFVLTNNDEGTMTPETHKNAAAVGSFCFVTTENGDEQDICKFITMPCVQRSLCLNEVTDDFGTMKVEVPKGVDGRIRNMLERCMATCGRAAGTRAKMRTRARKEASAQEERGYHKQFAEAKHLEYRSWVDNEVFDLIRIPLLPKKSRFRMSWPNGS